MKYILPTLTTLLFYGLSISFSTAQAPLPPDSALSYLRENYPQEKVFLQTDKTQYFTGETIWMKAWCTIDLTPTFLSNILYVDLINSSGKVIQKKMYRLDSLSSTPADIDIPAEAVTGSYTVNAYTLWMLNFPGFISSKNIFIYNTSFTATKSASRPAAIQVHFFPEGGDLIAGLKSRVAFKSTDQDGFPVAIQGYITDESGNSIAGLQTEHDGMGAFEIQPEAGKRYKAIVPLPDGNSPSFALPAIREEGITLRVENSNPNRLFVLLNRADKNKEQYNKLKVVAQMNHQLLFEANLNFEEGTSAAPITKKKLPPGIMQITVFNEQDIPLAERIVFIENYQLTMPDILAEQVQTQARGENQLSFSLPGISLAAVSCLVTSSYADTTIYEANNISTSLLLTSDLRGYVHHPGYYFRDKSPQTLHHLDLLLMTHGWRRFDWKQIEQHQFPSLVYPVESSIVYRGTVYKSDRKEPITDGKVSFIIKSQDSTSILAEAGLTDKGEFLLKDIHFKGQANVAYMGTNNKKQQYIVDVKLMPSYLDTLSTTANTPQINLDTTDIESRNSLLAQYLYGRINLVDTFGKGANNLGNVTIKSKALSREDSLNKEYAGGPFLMGKSIDPGSIRYARSIWQVIQQSVPGVTVEGNPLDPNVSFSRFNGMGGNSSTTSLAGSSNGDISINMTMQENGIAYYLNEVNVSKDIINTLIVEDVALIKVLKNEGAILGATQGVIAIYTKKGAVARKTPYEKGYMVEKREGYAITKEFYAPDYASSAAMNTNEPDRRATLYWNGKIRPARDGRYRFRFSNNDFGHQYKLVIQGIDATGHLVYVEKIIR